MILASITTPKNVFSCSYAWKLRKHPTRRNLNAAHSRYRTICCRLKLMTNVIVILFRKIATDIGPSKYVAYGVSQLNPAKCCFRQRNINKLNGPTYFSNLFKVFLKTYQLRVRETPYICYQGELSCVLRHPNNLPESVRLFFLDKLSLAHRLVMSDTNRDQYCSNRTNCLNPGGHVDRTPHRCNSDVKPPPQHTQRKESPYNPNAGQLHVFRHFKATHRQCPFAITRAERMPAIRPACKGRRYE